MAQPGCPEHEKVDGVARAADSVRDRAPTDVPRVVASHSTLRFRGREEIADSLEATGFRLRSVRDAPDRPGLELVFFAQLRAKPPT